MTQREMAIRFNIQGTLGNESDLIAIVPPKPQYSFHLRNLTRNEEVAIRYNLESIQDAYEKHWTSKFEGKSTDEMPREFFEITARPIFNEQV